MSYVTGRTIRELREKRKLTQKELAEKISVSHKTISKWETGKGLPDMGIVEDLSKALGVSVGELLTGEYRENENLSGNMKKVQFYVCPVCGNIIAAMGSGSYSCCGITLPKQDAEECDDNHFIQIEAVENEYCITLHHPMEKNHYVSFVAYVTSGNVEIAKLYPEQDISVRFKRKGHGFLYVYCNRHGMFKKMI